MRASTFLLAAGLSALVHAAPTHKKRASKLQFFCVNESGLEFGAGNLPGVYGTDYTWPTFSTYDTFIGQGMNTFRINILMERLTPSGLTGGLDTAYLGNLTQQVDHITNAGAHAIVCPHNYGRFNGDIVTSTADFQTWWDNVGTVYKANSLVIFDTNNEYHDMAGSLVASLKQAAINGIRNAGATSQYITAEGNAYTGAWTTATATGTTDGEVKADLSGKVAHLLNCVSANNVFPRCIKYLDSDGSGTYDTCVNSTIGLDRLKAATAWLRSNNKQGLLGKYAGAVNSV